VTSLSEQDRDSTDILLNQLMQFYSNNATNLHHLHHTVRAVAPKHRDRTVITDYPISYRSFRFSSLSLLL